MEQLENNQNEEMVTGNKCSTWNIIQKILSIIVLTGVFQSLIGITQFFTQSAIGIFWLKESLISPIIPGVAKIILDGDIHIRAYGLFPHPNILGGFLALSIMISLFYIKMFHVEHFNDNINNKEASKVKCSTWNILHRIVRFTSRNKILLLQVAVFIQAVTLLLTFSKSAIFGLLIGLFYVSANTLTNDVPRGTLFGYIKTNIKMFHVEHFRRKIVLLALIAVSLFIVLKPDLNSLFIKSLQERELYLNVSRGTFLADPFFGIGAGQFVINTYKNYQLETWQYQPVHNIFLLIANEYGLFMLILFIFFIFKLFKSNNPNNNSIILLYLKGILLSFIFMMMFDHYLWDIQQGQILFWILLALIASQHKNRDLN